MNGVPQEAPSLFRGLGCWLALQGGHDRLSKLSAEFRDDGRRHVDARASRALGMVEFLWPESYLTAHESVIRVVVRAVVAACGEYAP